LKISVFHDAVDQLTDRYNLEAVDIIDILVNVAEGVFDSPIAIREEAGEVFLLRHVTQKKINLTESTLKKLTKRLEASLLNTSQSIQLAQVKYLLRSKKAIKVNIVGKNSNGFICTSGSISMLLPFQNIPTPDIGSITTGSTIYVVIHAYSTKHNSITANMKHLNVEIIKVEQILRDVEIFDVNRAYGKRVKIYVSQLVAKPLIEALRIIYPSERVLILKRKRDMIK
jgi:hypothetical protein